MFSADGMHPPDAGYAVVANCVMDKARQDLSNNPRFDAITKASPIDEKAALPRTPHGPSTPSWSSTPSCSTA